MVVTDGQHENVAKAGAYHGALERMLPARLVAPEMARGSCFVIVLQRSSSMDGKKMDPAKLAALEVVENLQCSDTIGVLTFADIFEWAVAIHKNY